MPVAELLRRMMQPFASSLNSHRILLYATVSTLAVSAAIVNALKNQSNFYAVAIYLSKSSRSVLVLANFGFLLALLCGRVVQHIFFGPLRAPEIERLYDRLWFFVTESLLAFTIFRDEFDIPFALMFGFLLFVKSFHWLASDRVEWMDQRPYPGPPTLFHVRMNALFLLLWVTDFLMFAFAVESIAANGVGGMVLFASEYTILMASALNTIAKYGLSVYEIRRAGQRGGENASPWENKSMWVFYIELATDFLKLSTYLTFFTLIITFYGLPLNIVRDVYITARSFITRLRALHRYQTATRNMDQRYPNATEEEMAAMTDRTCIICREEMTLRGSGDDQGPRPAGPQVGVADGPNTTPKKLPCGHVFHFHCLRSWLERQQSCPTCRRTVLETDPRQQAAGARLPQPGAPPQQGNIFGLQGMQAGQQAGNNGLGLLGRLLGIAVQPPVAGGPFARGPLPQFPPQGAVLQNPAEGEWVNLQQQPGVTINIQYHVRGQQDDQVLRAQAPQPQPLQALPPFQGFQGPDGVWHPWMIREPVIPRNVSQTTPRSAEASHSVAQSSTAPQTSHQGPGDTATDNQTPNHPRAAAALAALRRLNPDETPSSSAAGGSPTYSVDSTGSAHAGSMLTSGPSSRATVPTVNGDAHFNLPSLIPLYDAGHPAPLFASATNVERQGVSIAGASVSSRVAPTENRPTSPVLQPSSQDRYSRTGLNEGQRSSSLQDSIPPLPPILTDDQLAIMDRVTREAIDERLRVLEGVSTAVFRCMEDLTRMRSALPVVHDTVTLPTQEPPVSSSDAATEKLPSNVDNKAQESNHAPPTSQAIPGPSSLQTQFSSDP